MLARGADIERETDDGATPLITSIYVHRTEMTKFLFKVGASVHRMAIDSPISHAATRAERAPEIFQIFLDYGAAIHITAG